MKRWIACVMALVCVFAVAGCGARQQEATITSGAYQMAESDMTPSTAVPILTFYTEGQTFTFGHDALSVSFASGTYAIQGHTLTCMADQGQQYLFELIGDDKLLFHQEGSSGIDCIDLKTSTFIPVEDGTEFVLFEAFEANGET